MFVNSHTHQSGSASSSEVFELVNFYTDQENIDSYFSIGVHPWYLDRLSFDRVQELAAHHLCLAIGETGVDRVRDENISEQIELFEKHIQLCLQLQKPLVVHAVKSYSDILEILKQSNFNLPIMLHDFNGNQQVIDQFLKYNTFFSMGDKLYNESSKGFKALSSIPFGRLLLETDDSSYLIQDMYQKASDILNIDISILKTQIIKNMNSFLGKNLISD